jgi:ribosomal protein S18 acetylase RimI-like enzyme
MPGLLELTWRTAAPNPWLCDREAVTRQIVALSVTTSPRAAGVPLPVHGRCGAPLMCDRVGVRVEAIGWEQTRGLRRQALGWADQPVAGDEDDDSLHLAVLNDEGEIQAVVSSCPHPCPDRPAASATYLWAMAVDERCRHRGLGSWLISELIARSCAAGRTVVWGDARASAVGFYRACGATVVGAPYRDPITGLEDRRVVFDLRGP